MKKKNQKSWIRKTNYAACQIFLLATLLFALFSMGCGSTKLAEGFDEAAVTEKAKEVVGLLNEKDYEGVCNMFSEDLKGKLTPEQLDASVGKIIKDRGEFKEIDNVAVIGQKIKDTEEDAAVAVVVASYENNKNTYTITFNTNMEMVGFYIK